MKKYCQSCGLRNEKENVCRLYNRKVNPTIDFCSRHTQTIYHCELCNNITLKPTFIPDGNTWHCYCSKCSEQINGCNFCRLGPTCAFETDPDPLPKLITQQTRTPFGIQQTQIKNPCRIEKFCNSCSCWNAEEKVCYKQFGFCNNINHIFKEPDWKKTDDTTSLVP